MRQPTAQLLSLCVAALLSLGAAVLPQACVGNCPPPEAPPAPITQANPAEGWSVVETGTPQDPLAAFGRRPIDEPRIIPFGGNYQDPNRPTPHYGIDYTFPDSFYHNIPQPIYPIGVGIVTAIHPCPQCWQTDDANWAAWGRRRLPMLAPENNYGYGALVLVEHPYNEYVSFYSLYAHLREIRVHVGQRVTSETQLALLGASGDVAAPHVHIEIRFGLPGIFWGADLNRLDVMRRWLALDVETPVFLLYPEHHIPFTKVLERWIEEDYPHQSRE
jgi:hypothetical protein